MSIPAHATRIIIAGHLRGGEIFSFGQWFDPGTALTHSTLGDLVTTCKTAFDSTLRPALQARMTASDGGDSVSGYYYDGSGPRAADQYTIPDAWVGSASAANVPGDMCAVVTTLTGRPGRSYRGRAYLPWTGPGLINGQFTSSDCTALANAYQSWLTTVKTATTPFANANPVICSQTKSVLTPVTQVKVDSKPDVQRRRLEKVAALFSALATV